MQRHPALAAVVALVVPGLRDRAQGIDRIEADQVGELEELADIDPAVALFQSRDPVLLFLHLLGEHGLADAGALPLGLEQLDQGLVTGGIDSLHPFGDMPNRTLYQIGTDSST